jgi:hypothetical protein
MRFQYLSLDTDITLLENVETAAKILVVPTSDTEPFVSALWVLSYFAYPNSEDKSKQDAFFRAMKFQWQISHVDPKLAKMFVEKKYLNILANGGKNIMRRVSAGRIALFQIFSTKKGQPTLQDQIQRERTLLGWSKDATESDSTYNTKVRRASRPVLHIATALAYVNAMNNNISLKKIISHLVADPLALIGFLELAENLRMGLPSIDPKYSLDQFVKIYVAKPIVVAQPARSQRLKWTPEIGPNVKV